MPNYTPDGEIIIEPVDFEDTEVYLLNTPLESDYKHTLYFPNKVKQEEYFKKKVMLTLKESSYQRKDNIIRVGRHIDYMRNCNYVMYRNRKYLGFDKWFYAFITDLKYINEGTTEVTIETDVIQTWLFDYVVQSSFIEREHVSSDEPGEHTFPEGLETGEYIVNSHFMNEDLNDLILVIGVTADPDGTKVGGHNYNGIYSGVKYKCCKATNSSAMTDYINSYDEEGRANAINCIFIAPEFLASYTDISEDGLTDISYNDVPKSTTMKYDKNNKLDGYKPDNNKLLCYPFNYLLVSNNNGGSAVYRYEDFSGDSYTFNLQGAITPGCSIRAIPASYKNDITNDDEGINLGKYPICNWQTDVYTNWLTQNSVNMSVGYISGGLSVAGGLLSSVGSFATGNVMGGVGGLINTAAGGVGTIGGIIGQKYAQSFQAPQVQGNLNCGDVITSDGRNTFHFYAMSVKKEYAKIIDDFFNMYGYKICRVKKPNTNHRESYWYTKTVDANIDGGSIPMKDMLKIKNCYNNGITFWRDHGYMGNYNLSNEIMTVLEGE